MPGCYEGLSHMSSSGSNCGNDRRHDERVQASEKLLQKLALLDGMMSEKLHQKGWKSRPRSKNNRLASY